MQAVVKLKPDALIMSDPGLIMMVRETFPDMPVHLSVQANAVNWATVKFWEKQGIERVILSRELSLDEIEDIRQHCPDIEIEVFVHGALCMAYSGRCLLSSYLNKRDPNQGTCTNSCRWKYDAHAATENETGDIVAIQQPHPTSGTGTGKPTDQMFLLQEQGRPNEYMPAFEDEHGTYIMNSKDLRAIQHVERLLSIGVQSLKIEGRTKSYYYCARTAQVYRKAMDDAIAGRPFDPNLMGTLENLAHRGYTEGFLSRHTHDQYQNYDYGYSISDRQQFVGEMTARNADGLAEVLVKNKFLVGDQLELMTPQGNINFTLEQLQTKKGELVNLAPGSGHLLYMPIPKEIDLSHALLMRNLNQAENTRNPHSK